MEFDHCGILRVFAKKKQFTDLSTNSLPLSIKFLIVHLCLVYFSLAPPLDNFINSKMLLTSCEQLGTYPVR